MASGWIKLHRCLLDDPVWKQATHPQRSVLIVPLLLANHAENKWTWNGKKYSCVPGQFITSIRGLADRADVTVKATRCAMERLRKLDFWALETAQEGTKITIRNWDKYQSRDDTEGHSEGQGRGTGGAHNKNDKNEKNTSLRKSAGENIKFAEFWKSYPRKKSKVDGQKVWKQVKGDSIFDEIMAGLQQAITSPDWLKEEGKYIPYPATWLRAGGWMDETGITTPKTCGTCSRYRDPCPGKDETCTDYKVAA